MLFFVKINIFVCSGRTSELDSEIEIIREIRVFEFDEYW